MTVEGRIFVVDDEPEICEALEIVLTLAGHDVTTETDSVAALERIAAEEFAVVITDIKMKGVDGYHILREAKRQWPETAVIVITSFGSIEGAVKALQDGASHYVTKPFVNEELRLAVGAALDRRALAIENRQLRQEVLSRRDELGAMVGRSDAMRRVFEMVRRIAPSRANVFLSGASGSGKSLLGRLLHDHSPRASKPFVTINCGAIPEALLESELFGHRRGAFTSAFENKDGLFRVANGGTVLLDELVELPPRLQVKLLNALQDREITPTGATRTIPIDIRVIAATNADVAAALADGRLREDLYYRLNVFELRLPPLTDRIDDIPLLVHHFLRRINDETGTACPGVGEEALGYLTAHGWPGNVRELQNIVERAVTLAGDRVIEVGDLPDRLTRPEEPAADLVGDLRLRENTRRFERRLVVRALQVHAGNKEGAARALEIDLATLYRKLDRLGIDKKTGRPGPA